MLAEGGLRLHNGVIRLAHDPKCRPACRYLLANGLDEGRLLAMLTCRTINFFERDGHPSPLAYTLLAYVPAKWDAIVSALEQCDFGFANGAEGMIKLLTAISSAVRWPSARTGASSCPTGQSRRAARRHGRFARPRLGSDARPSRQCPPPSATPHLPRRPHRARPRWQRRRDPGGSRGIARRRWLVVPLQGSGARGPAPCRSGSGVAVDPRSHRLRRRAGHLPRGRLGRARPPLCRMTHGAEATLVPPHRSGPASTPSWSAAATMPASVTSLSGMPARPWRAVVSASSSPGE